jgi:hypothetical protein
MRQSGAPVSGHHHAISRVAGDRLEDLRIRAAIRRGRVHGHLAGEALGDLLEVGLRFRHGHGLLALPAGPIQGARRRGERGAHQDQPPLFGASELHRVRQGTLRQR